jgi:hypothetical protein
VDRARIKPTGCKGIVSSAALPTIRALHEEYQGKLPSSFSLRGSQILVYGKTKSKK